ncbi:MAG: hypothetical protein RL026_174 [Pseudomonadota bacterium]
MEHAQQLLLDYVEPASGLSLRDLDALRDLQRVDGHYVASLRLPFPVGDYGPQLEDALAARLAAAGITEPLRLRLQPAIASHAVQPTLQPLKDIRNIVAVGSGKGGVGKSTVAVNLALAWAAAGARVGLLDADVYGPSQPIMTGLVGRKPEVTAGKKLVPLEAHGLKVMSIGLLVDASQPMVWRGPMATQALSQLLNDCEWGPLDYLVIDLPPGTGDIQLTLAQKIPVAGAVIVTTPQEIATADALKGLRMFEKVSVPVLGIVENMSTHVCSQCGHVEALFGEGGGLRLAQESGLRLLGQLPLDARVRAEADGGAPSIVAAPQSARAAAFRDMARNVAGALACRPVTRRNIFGKIVVEERK